jgi:hypothetical protein
LSTSPAKDSSEKYTGPYRKPRADVYTVLLILALIAILLATILLYMEQERFQFEIKGGPTPTSASNITPNPVALSDGPAAKCDFAPGLG